MLYRQAKDLVEAAGNVLITLHINPDGDSLGSALALGRVLEQIGKSCHVAGAPPVPSFYAYLPGIERVIVETPDLTRLNPDLIIIPDCSDLDRLGDLYSANKPVFLEKPIINLDHHVSNQAFGCVNIVDPTAAACAEQLFFLFEKWEVPLDAQTATCLLTGIITDTQGFRTISTTARTLRVAADLVEAGALLNDVMDRSFNSKPLSTVKLLGQVLNTIQSDGDILWAEVTRKTLAECLAGDEEAEMVTNFLAGIQGVRLAVLFKETRDGFVKVSLRSSPGVDSARLAAHFGGGGHKAAAGFPVRQELALARAGVLTALKEQMARGH